MARGKSGAALRSDGTVFVGDVTLADPRTNNLRKLIVDLARPGLCIVLGAGASHGLVPVSPKEIAELAYKLLKAQSNFQALSPLDRAKFEDHPELKYLTRVLKTIPTLGWDQFLLDVLSPAQAGLILSDVFTPAKNIPEALVKIFDAFENRDGVIVTYNYDRIAERQNRFPVVAAHGQVPSQLLDEKIGSRIRSLAEDGHIPINTDWHLPIPENEEIRARPAYNDVLRAWKCANTVVFIGYGFGGGADAISFQDFADHLSLAANVHVICPSTDNADLCKQIGSGLRARRTGFKIYGQPYRWRPFAEALLETLRRVKANNILMLLGREVEIGRLHDMK